MPSEGECCSSACSSRYGRLLGTLRADELSDGVMVVAVPSERVPTLYARTGEIVPPVALAFCVLIVVRVVGALKVAKIALRTNRDL